MAETSCDGQIPEAEAVSAQSAPAVPVVEPPPKDGAAGLLGPLAHRDFRLFLGGTVAESTGVWVYLTAVGWVALELTDSPFLVSFINVMWFTPFFVLALPSGVIADRFPRRQAMLVIRATAGTILLTMALFTFAVGLNYLALCLFTFAVGAMVALDLPIRNSFIGMLVRPAELVNATALIASETGVMRVVGPLVAGFLLARFGGGGGFAVYGIAQMIMIFFLFQIRERGVVPRDLGKLSSPQQDLKDGLRYIAQRRDVTAIVALSILTGVVGWTYIALLPVVAREVLDGDSFTLGMLSMSIGVGGLPVALTLSFYRGFRWSGRAMVTGLFIWGLAVISFAFSTVFALSVAMLGIAGLGFTAQNILNRSLILRVVERAYHGRVFGVLSLTWGANIFGTLAAGGVADALGVATAIAGSGALILIATASVLIYNPRVLRL